MMRFFPRSQLQAVLSLTHLRVCTFPLTFPPVLAAAVTQASLRSVLHKLLAAGPAFNITALLSAAQHSNQGTAVKTQLPVPFKGSCVCFMVDSSFHVLFGRLLSLEAGTGTPCVAT